MRTIRLTEWVGAPVELRPRELEELDALPQGLLVVAPQRDGSFRLTPRSHVGTIALPSLRLLIRPKCGLRNVLLMLSYASGIAWSASDFPYEPEDLTHAIAWWFDREAQHATRHGLHRDYVDRSESLATVRGRPAIDRQVAAHPGRRVPISCRFQEHGEDTVLNRVIKAAHLALLRMPDLDRALSARLRHRARQVLGDVSSVEYGPAAVPDLALTRQHRAWRPAALLAELVLRQQALRDELGHVWGRAFTVNMEALFQRFVETIVRERATASGFALEACVTRPLTLAAEQADGSVAAAVRIAPDLVVTRGGLPVAVGDVKYKAPRLEIGDVYQLVTYCVRLGLEHGLLIYCGEAPLRERPVIDASLTCATIGIDVCGDADSVVRRARAAADVLVQQAAAARQRAA